MAAAGASDGLFRSIYKGCISGCDIIIEHRPYHRNCGCALHDKSRRTCPHGSPKSTNLSYPIKRVWQEGCLALDAAAASPPSSPRFTGIHATVKQKRKEEPPSPRFTSIHATMKQQRKEDDNDDEDKYMAITAKPWK